MNNEDFFEQFQLELLWREREIRLINNTIQKSDNQEVKNTLKRAAICLYYAHIEGFVKFSFKIYIDSINNLNLKCNQVRPVLAAAVYHTDFYKLTNPDSRSKIFKKKLPDDSHLHRVFRHEEFIENISEFFDKRIEIEDGYINTESNVGREVIEKLLYQVGLPHKLLEKNIPFLSRLKNKRNGISHGSDRTLISDQEYQSYYDCVTDLIKNISNEIYKAFQSKMFLK